MIRTLYVDLFGAPMGVLLLRESGICDFQYLDSFLSNGLQPSPLMMPTSARRVFSFPSLGRETFCGLPGMIADSLPDRFGRALLDEWLTAEGRDPHQENVLERLSFQGRRGMGALEFRPAREGYMEESSLLEIDDLIETARRVLSSKEAFLSSFKDKEKAIADIIKIGTSAGGQRAKAVIALNEKTGEIRSGQVDAPEDFSYWILKLDGFDSSGKPTEASDFGRIEYAFSECVKDAGIDMAECRLVEENSRAHFMTKRFDREGGEKLHMQTLCAIAHYDFQIPGGYSYDQAFAVMRLLSLPYTASDELFRRMVFNTLAVNMDDHTKNISFLMDEKGTWSLSPAYDMGFSHNPQGIWTSGHQMTINGKRNGITLSDLEAVARRNGIHNPKDTIEAVDGALRNFRTHAEDCGVPDDKIRYIEGWISSSRAIALQSAK